MIGPLLSAASRCFCLTAMGRRVVSDTKKQKGRFVLFSVLTGILCLGLASCGGRENKITEETQLRSELPVPPQVILDGGFRRQQSETRVPPPEKDTAAPTPEAPASPTSVQEDTLASIPLQAPEQQTPEASTEPGLGVLMNLSETQIIDRLGEPSFHRQEGQALHWQYRRDGCILDLFLVAYARAENTKPNWLVTHIDLRSDRPDAEISSKAIEKCFADMLG